MNIDGQSFWLGVLLGTAAMLLVMSAIALNLYTEERKRRQKLETPRGDPKPVCGCNHHRSFHDDQGCHWEMKTRYESENSICGCKMYIGPPTPANLKEVSNDR